MHGSAARCDLTAQRPGERRVMSRLKLSSLSFSDAVATMPRKSPSNPYVLSAAAPSFGGFDVAEAAKYRKGLFRFRKKDKEFGRRNTLSGCNVLKELLDDRDLSAKGRIKCSEDDVVLQSIVSTLPRSNTVVYRRQQSLGDIEVRTAGGKNSGIIRHRYGFSKMSEGRKAQIILLDDATLEILIQPKLLAFELLDLVASHFGLKEREYFGLAFRDETNHYQWLQQDRKVLEHEFIKKTGSLVLHFGIRFFIESITYLRDGATVELFYCLAKQAVYREQIECCSSEVVFELAALALHETYGDYLDNETARKHLLKLPVLPTGVLKEHPSIAFCEEQVIEHYKKLVGISRGTVIVQYMGIIESLPTYGIHYYEVKDKSGIPWWLGISYKGIALYDSNDKKMPRRVFAWGQLENLYYREKKFSIEVHDPKRVVHTLSSFNLYEDAILEPLEDFDELSDAISDPTTQVSVSRRTFGPSNVNVHAWFAATAQLTKSIWSMAVSQHQFYLDRKQNRSQSSRVGRSLTDIAVELCQTPPVFSSSTTPAVDGLRSVSSSQCLSSSTALSTSSASVDSGGLDSEAKKALQHELYMSLKVRKEVIEDKLRGRLEKLKEICLQEAELTGELPGEYPLEPGESAPAIRKRIGTTFPLSPKIMNRDSECKDEMSRLELEYELQSKIVKAAHRLIQENSDKNIRKTRQQAYQKEIEKLSNLSQKLVNCQQEIDRRNLENERFFSPLASPGPARHQFYDSTDASMPQLYRHKTAPIEARRSQCGSDVNCAQLTNSGRKPRLMIINATSACVEAQTLQPKSAPSSPVRQFFGHHHHPLAGLASPLPNRHQKTFVPATSSGIVPDSVCASHGHQNNAPLHRVQRQLSSRLPARVRSCTEHDNNMYNIRTRQSDCYESGDELNLAHAAAECSHGKHYAFANDNLCSLHRMYREQVACSHHRSYECPDLVGARPAPERSGYTRADPLLSYDNRIYGVPTDRFECEAGCKSTTALSHPYPNKSPSKDSAIHLASSLSSLSHAAAPFRCEPLFFPRQQNSRAQPPPFFEPSGEPPLPYDGANLSHAEPSPMPEKFAGSLSPNYPNFREVSKPFEMSDFYKYSERLRRQRHHDEGSRSPLCSSSSGSLPRISRSVGAMQTQDVSSSYASSIGASDQAASVDGIAHGCAAKEPGCVYPLHHRDLFRSPIHAVGSDSCIVYPSCDDTVMRPVDHPLPLHSSSPYAVVGGTQAVRDSEGYLPANRNRSNIESGEVSFGSFRAGEGVAEAFGEEMLAWFEKNDELSQSPDGPSTLV